jgi:hypothetical protein
VNGKRETYQGRPHTLEERREIATERVLDACRSLVKSDEGTPAQRLWIACIRGRVGELDAILAVIKRSEESKGGRPVKRD